MADTGNCCGGKRGKHLDGCDGKPASAGARKRRAIVSRREKQEDYDAAKARQQENAKMKNVGKPRDTEWMNAEIPKGHKSVKNAGGYYVIVKK